LKEFINHIIIHYLIHLAIIISATTVFGVFLNRVFKDSTIRSFRWFIPIYNLVLWFKTIQLPRWLILPIIQIYWYPTWWGQAFGISILLYALWRTDKKQGINIIAVSHLFIATTLVFLLCYLFPQIRNEFQLGILLIPLLYSLLIPKHLNKSNFSNEFNKKIVQKFKSNLPGRIAANVLGALVFVALYAPFIASQFPLAIEIDGKIIHPVSIHLSDSESIVSETGKTVSRTNWNQYDKKLMPPVPYLPDYQDKLNRNFKGPFDDQQVLSCSGLETDERLYWHHLGTDRIGRDILSGLIHGTSIALTVGIVAMGIAAFFGVFFGIVSGYFGNNRLVLSRIQIILLFIGLFLGYFYAFIALKSIGNETDGKIWFIVVRMIVFMLFPVFFLLIGKLFKKNRYLSVKHTIPLDSIIMRITEFVYSIPALLLVIVLAAIMKEKSLTMVMVIIGAISWTGIARLTRAETLRVVGLDYIESARALGLKNYQIIQRHILPNVLGPVFVAVSFGMAAAVLLESSLSFLGIGVPEDVVTWGSMMNAAFVSHSQDKIWLVLVPGIAIFVIITVYNLIGEALRDALDPKHAQ